MDRKTYDRQTPHSRAELRSDETPAPSVRAAMFLPDPERPVYDGGIEPDDAVRAACKRNAAKAGAR